MDGLAMRHRRLGRVLFCTLTREAKPCFRTAQIAQKAADRLDQLPGGPHGLHVYRCGSHFHLTSMEPVPEVDEPTELDYSSESPTDKENHDQQR